MQPANHFIARVTEPVQLGLVDLDDPAFGVQRMVSARCVLVEIAHLVGGPPHRQPFLADPVQQAIVCGAQRFERIASGCRIVAIRIVVTRHQRRGGAYQRLGAALHMTSHRHQQADPEHRANRPQQHRL